MLGGHLDFLHHFDFFLTIFFFFNFQNISLASLSIASGTVFPTRREGMGIPLRLDLKVFS
jgi:hypothetical protein